MLAMLKETEQQVWGQRGCERERKKNQRHH